MKIILHSHQSRESRELVASIPKDQLDQYVIIDWYEQHAVDGHECKCVNGSPYEGPGPSAFPEIVFFDENPPDLTHKDQNGSETVEKQEPAWARIRAATTLDTTDRSKIDARKVDDRRRLDTISKESDRGKAP